MMLKTTLAATALVAVLATPVFAQSSKTSKGSMTPNAMQSTQSFINQQQATNWRSSKLVGANVYGSENAKIGDINDIIVGSDGQVRAVVIGVGGFLGIGEKNVAVPFNKLSVQRKANSDAIEKVTVSLSKEQLKNAPKFAYYKAPGSNSTTGSGSNTMSPMGQGSGNTKK